MASELKKVALNLRLLWNELLSQGTYAKSVVDNSVSKELGFGFRIGKLLQQESKTLR
jgi:hypothetical protein